jgi:hypothetical protein
MQIRFRFGTVAAAATGAVLALVLGAAAPAAAGPTPVSLDTYGSPGPVVGIASPPQQYTATVRANWWTAIGVAGGYSDLGGYSYDYQLTASQVTSGATGTTGPQELDQQDEANVDVVAINTNYIGQCPANAGSYLATVAGIGPTNGRGTSSPLGYQVWKTFAGQAVAPGPQDHPLVIEIPTDVRDMHPFTMLDIYLQAGHKYEFSYNPYTTDSHGGFWLFAADPTRCLQTLGDAVVNIVTGPPKTELYRYYTAPTSGWYGLGLLTGAGWRFAAYDLSS